MFKKSLASLMVVGALIVAMGTTSAFAATTTNPICNIASCTQTGTHQHNGKTYAAHTAGDGHTYHNNCGVSGCTLSGNHQHNSGHNNGNHGHNGNGYGGHH